MRGSAGSQAHHHQHCASTYRPFRDGLRLRWRDDVGRRAFGAQQQVMVYFECPGGGCAGGLSGVPRARRAHGWRSCGAR